MKSDDGRSRAVLGLLVLTCVTIITLDARHDDDAGSPVDPLRSAVGSVLGPAESAAATALRPVTGIPDYFGDVDELRQRNAALESANAELVSRLRVSEANVNRSGELDRIAAFADDAEYDVVPAQVVGIGPAQSFSRTVTIDAGSRQGVSPDLMVVTGRGLVGRVISSTATTSTVLLIVDGESTIGGRLSDSMELGFLDGDGDISGQGTLELSLVDHTVSPEEGDTVVTWGSRNGAPYLPGVPIGSVVSVHSTPSELTQTAEIEPFVDFSSLDVVAVVTGHRGGDTATDVAASPRRSGR